MKIFVATQNKKKLKELDRILTPMGFTVLSPKDLDKPFGDVEETGTTFEENALIKGLFLSSCGNIGKNILQYSSLCRWRYFS